MNSEFNMYDVKPEFKSEMLLSHIDDSICYVSHPKEIKEEITHTELNINVKQKWPLLEKSEVKNDSKQSYVYSIKQELVPEELDIKSEILDSLEEQASKKPPVKSTNKTDNKKETSTREKRFKCSICDYRFLWRKDLERHMKVHTGEKPFKCRECSYRCIQKYTLEEHVRTHTGEKSFKCSVCDYSSVRKSTLKTHMNTHISEKPFKCDLCNCTFKRDGNLRFHLKKHKQRSILKADVYE